MKERELFEQKFPIPNGVYWNGISEQYDGLPGSVGLDEIEAYQARFEGWQAARSQGGEVEPVVAYRYRVIDDPQGWEYSSTPLFGPDSVPGPKEEYQALTLDQLLSELNDTHPPAPTQGESDNDGKGSLPWFVEVYNHGYQAGHNDTVEGYFTYVHCSDIQTYHEDEVMELLERLNIDASREPTSPGDGCAPDWLFDGYAIYQNLTDEQKTQTSAKNVSDVLDAIVAMIKHPQPPVQGGE